MSGELIKDWEKVKLSLNVIVACLGSPGEWTRWAGMDPESRETGAPGTTH
jgi:hypothetical protein